MYTNELVQFKKKSFEMIQRWELIHVVSDRKKDVYVPMISVLSFK